MALFTLFIFIIIIISLLTQANSRINSFSKSRRIAFQTIIFIWPIKFNTITPLILNNLTKNNGKACIQQKLRRHKSNNHKDRY